MAVLGVTLLRASPVATKSTSSPPCGAESAYERNCAWRERFERNWNAVDRLFTSENEAVVWLTDRRWREANELTLNDRTTLLLSCDFNVNERFTHLKVFLVVERIMLLLCVLVREKTITVECAKKKVLVCFLLMSKIYKQTSDTEVYIPQSQRTRFQLASVVPLHTGFLIFWF